MYTAWHRISVSRNIMGFDTARRRIPRRAIRSRPRAVGGSGSGLAWRAIGRDLEMEPRGLTPVKKFTNPQAPVSQISKAIQSLNGGREHQANPKSARSKTAKKRGVTSRKARGRTQPAASAREAVTTPRYWDCSGSRSALRSRR